MGFTATSSGSLLVTSGLRKTGCRQLGQPQGCCQSPGRHCTCRPADISLPADARQPWLDALSSAGALAGLIAVAAGQSWGDPVAGLAVTAFICHVGYQVTKDVVHCLADGVDPEVITTAEAAAGSVPGVIHAHARARWTGRTLRVEVEGWVDPGLSARDADALGRVVAGQISRQLPQAGSFTWTTRAAPGLSSCITAA
jgi:divalent metal cation (Fe/Co/Zn/Cd) transporter